MPGPDYIPSSETHFAQWYKTFSEVCAENATVLNLSTEDVESISQAALTLYQSIVAVNEAKAKLSSLITEKDDVKQSSADLARGYAKLFKASKGVDPAMLKKLGVVSTSKSSPVSTVKGLMVQGYANGVNKLTWNRGENSGTTIFLIEFSYDTPTDWQFAGAVTKTSYEHQRQNPGRTVHYRITATRSGKSSPACPPVIVYAPQGAFSMSAAA